MATAATPKTPSSPNAAKGDFPVISDTEAKRMNILSVKAHMKPITDIQFSREGDVFFTSSKEKGVCMWSTATGDLLGIFDCQKAVSNLDVNGETTFIATAGLDYFARIFDVSNGRELVAIEEKGPCKAVGFSHDDRMLFVVCKVGGGKTIINIYNLPETLGVEDIKVKFNPVITIEPENDVTCCCWGPTNETVYYGDAGGDVVVYNLDSRRETSFNSAHSKAVNRIHFSQDYLTLITCGMDNYACLLDPRDLKIIQKYQSSYPVFDASISPISDHVLLGGGTSAELVTTSGGDSTFSGQFYHKVHENMLGSVKLHFGTIICVRYHPSGKIFASAGVDGHVKVCSLPEFVTSSAPGAVPLWKKGAEGEEEYDGEEYEEFEEDYYNEEEEEEAVAPELDDI